VIGAVLAGRFELTGLLAESPIFSLYSAKDRLLGREISVRLLKPPFDREPAFRAALAEAVKKSSSVQSPSVERLYELQEDGDEAYVVGDLTRAASLSDRIRKLAPFTSPVAIRSAIGIARGLDAFHKAQLVHGDVSGENVAMLADGEAKLQLGGIWEAYSASQTAGAVVLPALAPYLAPEISSGAMPSKRSDVYSVGVLLFELLTGRKPYVADTAIATAMRHTSEATPRVRSISPSVPVVLDEIVYKAMAKNPADRYSQAGDLLLDLRQMQDAMRFGRTLIWPLRAQSQPQAAPARQAVAPRMSAIRDESRTREADRPERDADVPMWMWIVGALVTGFVLCVIGFYVVLNLNRPRLVSVPPLQGLSVSEARSRLESLHLGLKVGSAVPSETYEPDKIIESKPGAGEKLPEGSATVTVTLSSGSREVDVPQLRGLTPDKARSVLATENLALDDQMDHSFDPALPAGTISKQDPPALSRVERNRKIHVAINEQNGDGGPSDSSQWYEYQLSVLVTGVSEPVDVRIEITDDEGTRPFYDHVHNPGDKIETSEKGHGSQATFQIYYDGKLVRSYTKQASEAAG
jgi:serine/threonine-protein kinase